jgi:hypothetical protein
MASDNPQVLRLAIPLDPKQDAAILDCGLDKPIREPSSFLSPVNDPKPQPQPQPQPIRDPQGYKTLSAGYFGRNKEYNCMHGHNIDLGGLTETLKETLDGFGVELKKPAFARMMHEQSLMGLTPMQRFLLE